MYKCMCVLCICMYTCMYGIRIRASVENVVSISIRTSFGHTQEVELQAFLMRGPNPKCAMACSYVL